MQPGTASTWQTWSCQASWCCSAPRWCSLLAPKAPPLEGRFWQKCWHGRVRLRAPALNTVTWDAACDSILIAHFAMLDTVAPFTGLQRRTLVWLLPGVANQHAQWHRNIWTGNTIPVAAAAALVFELVPLHHSPTCVVAPPHRWAVLAWSCGMTCLWAWRGCHEVLWHWGCSIAGLVSTPRNSG